VLDIIAGPPGGAARVLALPVRTDRPHATDRTPTDRRDAPGHEPEATGGASGDGRWDRLIEDGEKELAEEVGGFLADFNHPGKPGTVHTLPRPGRDPGHVVLVGIGTGDEAGWRAAGAGLARSAAKKYPVVTVRLPADPTGVAARAVAEGAWLASYRYRLGAEPTEQAPKLRRIVLAGPDPDAVTAQIAHARVIADAVVLARDLTNAPSLQKSPKWLADRIANAAARRKGVTITVRDERELAAEGFGGILAVGAGSARPPRLVELSWRPRRPRAHVVLVGKGITFDSGGYFIKPVEGMKLMRKDMGGAAAVCAAVLGAADLGLPVRVTALAPMAENMISGSAMRPGDLVRQYGGLTVEVRNTDAEGRVVLGDALAYAARRLKPDLVVDLATLTGAQSVSLGKRTAALFSHDDALAEALTAAGAEVGERMWRMPLAEEYAAGLASPVADLVNDPPGPGAVVAALYLREFTGPMREHWAHLDMSAPAWIEKNEGDLVKGATGWGVRTLLRWLATLAHEA